MEEVKKQTIEYIAIDGKGFASKDKCLEYEAQLKQKRRYEVTEKALSELRVPFSEQGYIPFEVFAHNEFDLGKIKRYCTRSALNDGLLFYRIESEEQLTLLAEYLQMKYRGADARCLVIKHTKLIGNRYPVMVAAGYSLGFGREMHTIYSDAEIVKKFGRLNGLSVTLNPLKK